MTRVICFVVFAMLLGGCCADSVCTERKILSSLPDGEAQERFSSLSPGMKVDIVSADLERSHPPHSKFEVALRTSGGEIANALIEKAMVTSDYSVYMVMMKIFGDLSTEQKKAVATDRVDAAIRRCREIEGPTNYLCDDIAGLTDR
jgi:hypothetical protein